MMTRTLGVIAATLVSAWASADMMYSGTWEVSGRAAGTLTLRVREDGVVSGSLVGNTGRRTSGHLRGTFEGKRFKIMIRLRNGDRNEFQGNFTRNESEAHMDGLMYVDNKPVDNVRLTLNAVSMTSMKPTDFSGLVGWSSRF